MEKARVLAKRNNDVIRNLKTSKNLSFKNQVLYKEGVDINTENDSKVFIIGLSNSPEKLLINFEDRNSLLTEEEKYNDAAGSEEISVQNQQIPDNAENYLELYEEKIPETNIEVLKEEFEAEAVPHMNSLYNFAIKLSGDEFEADDLVQDTMTRAYRFFYQFEKGTNCKAWLFRIMKNLFINEYRKNQKQPAKVDYNDIENFVENIKSDRIDSTDLQEKVFSNLFDDELTKALNSLKDDFKTVVILCDIEGLSYEEIADFVQCPVGTIRSRLHRGRKMLHKKLLSYARKKGYVAPK